MVDEGYNRAKEILTSKIDIQLGSLYDENKSWDKQLVWGILKHKSILPSPSPIIDKLEYE